MFFIGHAFGGRDVKYSEMGVMSGYIRSQREENFHESNFTSYYLGLVCFATNESQGSRKFCEQFYDHAYSLLIFPVT